jgi:hypothetical protein
LVGTCRRRYLKEEEDLNSVAGNFKLHFLKYRGVKE